MVTKKQHTQNVSKLQKKRKTKNNMFLHPQPDQTRRESSNSSNYRPRTECWVAWC